MNQIWNTTGQKVHPLVLAYTAKDDTRLDADVFLPYDIQGTLAHAAMLHEMGMLTENELKQAQETLGFIEGVSIPEGMEDGHTYLEAVLTQKHSELGKKIHTARSRNDQALTMIRLYMKDQFVQMDGLLSGVIKVWSKWVEVHADIPMPGYTHMQKAMPTTVGQWQGAYVDALKDLQIYLKNTADLCDQSPLGSGAGFGIPIKLNRKLTAKQMGFAKVQENPIYCQLSRGPFESMTAFACLQIMTLLSRWANDLLLFTTSEFDYFELPEEFCTSSSIMPQKKNYDALEIMRGSAAIVQGNFIQIHNLHSGLHTGYHRDLQLLKKPLVECCQSTAQSLEMASLLGAHLQVKEQKLKSAMTEELFATDKVYELVKEGLSFRDAYAAIKKLYS